MKSLVQIIQERLIIKKNKYKYFPKTKQELKAIIKKRIEKEGNEVDLNDIDVSKITDMSDLFVGTDFNGDISQWNTSNVTDMSFMFYDCESFNQDISTWDVSNVKNMRGMFLGFKKFNTDISDWDVSNVKFLYDIFLYWNRKEKYKPKFK